MTRARALHLASQVVGRGFAISVVLLGVSWSQKGRPIAPEAIDSALLPPPEQSATSRPAFTFSYRGQACRVRPVAEYRLTGLVLSHNDVESFADIYHDASSVDTKDLCLLWGSSLLSEDFHQVEVSSGPFTCYFRYPRGIRFEPHELSNNHLITADDAIRARLASVHVGDQVRIGGLLVDYQMEDWRDFWRETSTARHDDGCEVIFVESFEVIREGAPRWNRLYRASWFLVATLPMLWVVLFAVSVPGRAPGAASGGAARRLRGPEAARNRNRSDASPDRPDRGPEP